MDLKMNLFEKTYEEFKTAKFMKDELHSRPENYDLHWQNYLVLYELIADSGLKDEYDVWTAEQEIDTTRCWYTENWTVADIVEALRDNNVPITQENVDKAIEEVQDIFSDLSSRNEALREAIEFAFAGRES